MLQKLIVDKNIAIAKTIHTDVYNSAPILETIKEKIFADSWQFIGSTELVKFAGDVVPFILLENCLNEPLLLSKTNQNQVVCVSNVCTHRGNIIAYKACSKAKNLRCKYHGRLFDLNGKFTSMPEFKEVQNFPTKDDDLPKLPLYNWANLLFTNVNIAQPQDPSIYFSEMIERLHWLPLQDFKYKPELTKTFEINANWALYCENYLEGFHIPFVHAGLNAALSFNEYSTELSPKAILQIGIGKDDEDCFDLPKSSIDYGKNIAAYYYFVFPNMMFNFYPWGLSVNVVTPNGVNKTKVEFIVYMWKEELYNKGAGSDLDKVEMEDEEIVENVQKGIISRFYKHGRYSVSKETGTHHFHSLIADALNA